MNRILAALYWIAMALIMAFITLPLLVVVAASLSPSSEVVLNPARWTFHWYGELWTAKWLGPFWLSVQIALTVSVISGMLGLLAAYVVAYRRCPAADVIMSFILSPLAVPQIVKGVAIVLFLSSAGLFHLLGTPGLIMAHVILTLPFATRMIATAVYNFDRNLDRAAQSLGAGRWQRIRFILLPLIKPGIFSGMTFTFILSFNNIPLSVFLVRPGQSTLPITVINYMEYSLTPVLAAVNVASLLFILTTIFVFEKLGGFSAQLHGGSK